ncbi:MAG: hypothetical protein GC185_01370 [Alphaproteobacteria bacterium]|nr:hypothetical protein [Alphaproteobacteria bacterium]
MFEKKQKKPTFGKPVGKPHRLRRAFLKATVMGTLVFGSYQYYTPPQYKAAVNNAISDVTGWEHAKGTGDKNLTFVFESANAPTVLGEKTKGIFKDNTNVPDNWFAAIGRQNLLMQNKDNAKAFHAWLSQLDDLKGKSIAEKAKGVDALIDQKIKYESDAATYQREDYWASPIETISNKQGDCEDFAILKYYALRYLDVPADKMFVLAVGQPGGDLDHATLTVDTREPGLMRAAWEAAKQKVAGIAPEADYVILDNDQSPDGKLIEQKDSRYQPYYAMNEKGIWSVPKNSKLGW